MLWRTRVYDGRPYILMESLWCPSVRSSEEAPEPLGLATLILGTSETRPYVRSDSSDKKGVELGLPEVSRFDHLLFLKRVLVRGEIVY